MQPAQNGAIPTSAHGYSRFDELTNRSRDISCGGRQVDLRTQERPLSRQSSATNFTHTGDPTSSICPVGVSFPVFASIFNTTMLSDF
jgi:hypothetical protein